MPRRTTSTLRWPRGTASRATGPISSRSPTRPAAYAKFGFGPDWAKTLELRVDALEPDRRVEWTPVGGFEGWIGTAITWRLEPTDDGATIIHFTHGGWPEEAADGEMAMCGYTWAMIIDRLSRQVADGNRAPYFNAGTPLPR